jgi:hypothetical protein
MTARTFITLLGGAARGHGKVNRVKSQLGPGGPLFQKLNRTSALPPDGWDSSPFNNTSPGPGESGEATAEDGQK